MTDRDADGHCSRKQLENEPQIASAVEPQAGRGPTTFRHAPASTVWRSSFQRCRMCASSTRRAHFRHTLPLVGPWVKALDACATAQGPYNAAGNTWAATQFWPTWHPEPSSSRFRAASGGHACCSKEHLPVRCARILRRPTQAAVATPSSGTRLATTKGRRRPRIRHESRTPRVCRCCGWCWRRLARG